MDGISEATLQPSTRLSDKWQAFWQAGFHGELLLVFVRRSSVQEVEKQSPDSHILITPP